MLLWIVLGIVALVLLYLIATYNQLVRLRALVKETFSGITVQLRRRADLIPNLVETVQGYATHEREVFEQVSKARAATVNAGSVETTAQADAQMTGLLGKLFAVAEAYPELKANTNFVQLQDQLASVEGELQGAPLLQRDRSRPQRVGPELPAGPDRATDGLHRGAFLPGRRSGHPERAEGVLQARGLTCAACLWRWRPYSSRRPPPRRKPSVSRII